MNGIFPLRGKICIHRLPKQYSSFLLPNRRCVRKMDHHCPWINNCVGENNQKFFVLFTFYIAIISLHVIALVAVLFVDCISIGTSVGVWEGRCYVIGIDDSASGRSTFSGIILILNFTRFPIRSIRRQIFKKPIFRATFQRRPAPWGSRFLPASPGVGFGRQRHVGRFRRRTRSRLRRLFPSTLRRPSHSPRLRSLALLDIYRRHVPISGNSDFTSVGRRKKH